MENVNASYPVRPARPEDFDQILQIYAIARDYMRRSGNPHQWRDNKPDPELLRKDISLGRLFVICDGASPEAPLLGCFACIDGEDPTYTYIEGGQWLNSLPYLTLHRCASSGQKKRILERILEWMSQKSQDIRVDTHEDNRTMQHILEKNGFTKCGIIYLESKEPRLAYHRHLETPVKPENS